MRVGPWLVIASLFVPAATRADEGQAGPGAPNAPGGQGAAAAEALFREGRALLRDGRLADACDKFGESKRLDPAPGTIINLARCYEDLGRTASAWAAYRELVVRATQLGQTARAEFGQQKAAELEPKLATLVITVPPASRVSGLSVEYDGIVLGEAAWGARMPVDPGRHRLRASARGHLPWSREIDVTATSLASLEVPSLVAFEGDATTRDAPRATNPAHVAGVVSVLAGVAAISAGIICRGVAKMEHDAGADLCVGGCSAEGRARNARGDDFTALSTALVIGGVVVTGAGTALSLLVPRTRPRSLTAAR